MTPIEKVKGEIANIILGIGADCLIHCKVEYQNCLECDICKKYLDLILTIKVGDYTFKELAEKALKE